MNKKITEHYNGLQRLYDDDNR